MSSIIAHQILLNQQSDQKVIGCPQSDQKVISYWMSSIRSYNYLLDVLNQKLDVLNQKVLNPGFSAMAMFRVCG